MIDWYSYDREICLIAFDDQFIDEGPIGGEEKVVEIDEFLVGKKKYNRGRLKEGNWILGMIEMDGTEYRLKIRPDNKRDSETLTSLITKHVTVGTEIWTDCWREYNDLENIPRMNYNTKRSITAKWVPADL